MEGFTMAQRSKQEYLRSIYDRYQHAPRAQKGTMLEEFCKVYGYNRKYAIWLLNRPLPEELYANGVHLALLHTIGQW